MKDYYYKLNGLTEADWCDILVEFEDATFFQTWHYGEINSTILEHVRVFFNDILVSACQVRIYKIPLIDIGIAYVSHGPIWRKKEQDLQVENLYFILSSLIREYSNQRGFILIINMEYFKSEPHSEEILKRVQELGFTVENKKVRHLLLPLYEEIDGIRRNLNQKWRNQLNAAEKKGLFLSTGRDKLMIDEFERIFVSMNNRKKLNYVNDFKSFKTVFLALSEKVRPLVILCSLDGQYVSGGIFSVLGERGIYLFGASNEIGMQSKGSYLIQWEIIKLLKESGHRYYNLSGVNEVSNPGTFHFKMGVAGKHGWIDEFLPTFVYSEGNMKKMLYKAIKFLKK